MARLLKDTTPLQRGIIRHLLLIIDLSSAMLEKDLRPTRYLLTLRYSSEFVTEFFEQNPISQLGIIGMRDGLAIRISDMSGNPNDHITNLQTLRTQEPKGNPSLQNALDMGRAALLWVIIPIKLCPRPCLYPSTQSRPSAWHPRNPNTLWIPTLFRPRRHSQHHKRSHGIPHNL